MARRQQDKIDQQLQIISPDVYDITLTPASGGAFLGSGDELYDQNTTTELTYNGVAYPATILTQFNKPTLVGRVSVRGGTNPIRGMTVSVVGVNGALTNVLVLAPGTSQAGADSGNFTPIMASGLLVTLNDVAGRATSISGISVLKVVETKTTVTTITAEVDNTPDKPLFVQDQGQVAIEEISPSDSELINAVSGNLAELFDKDIATEVQWAGDVGDGLLVTFKSPLLIARIGLHGGTLGLPNTIEVIVTDIDGNPHMVCSWGGEAPDLVPGKDSGNFKVVEEGPGSSPILAKSVTIIDNVGIGRDWTISEVIIYKVIETKSFVYNEETEPIFVQEQGRNAQLTEFYGQKVSYDPFVDGGGNRYYLLLRRPLEVDADNDPSANNDSTVASVTSDTIDSERIAAYFYVPMDDIRTIRNHALAMATVECGSNMRCTTLRYRLYMAEILTGALTPITAEKSVTLNIDGPTSRAVRAILQDLTLYAIPEDYVLVLLIRVFGRQVSSSSTPAYITLWHRRGLGDVKFETEVITQVG